jgi:hypothetical protein
LRQGDSRRPQHAEQWLHYAAQLTVAATLRRHS